MLALVATLALALTAGFAGDLLAGLAAALLTGLAADLGAALGVAFFTTGLPLETALATAVLADFAGAVLVSFFAAAAGLAVALFVVLVFFTAVFELVLRGFFTSCLLAVAACVLPRSTSHWQMNCGHRLICVKTHIFRPSGRMEGPN